MSATGVIDVIGVGQIIAAFLQFFKVVLERWLKPTDPLHDPAIQLSAGVLGVVGYVAHAATLAPLTGAIFWDQAGVGFLSGLSAIVTFHLLTTTTPDNPLAVNKPAPGRTPQQADPNLFSATTANTAMADFVPYTPPLTPAP